MNLLTNYDLEGGSRMCSRLKVFREGISESDDMSDRFGRLISDCKQFRKITLLARVAFQGLSDLPVIAKQIPATK